MNIVRAIMLTQWHVALVDDQDWERARAYKWHASSGNRTWYARRTPTRTNSYRFLHRFILNAPPDLEVDHVNGDGLDCRRANLRLATKAQNQWNRSVRGHLRSEFKGVMRHRYGYWSARVKTGGVERATYWRTELEAAVAYNTMAVKAFGDFARLNPVPSDAVCNERYCLIPGCQEPTVDGTKLNKRFCSQHSQLPDWKRSEIRKKAGSTQELFRLIGRE